MSTILFLKNNNSNEKVINTKNITRTNKLKYVHLYICVKTTTNTSTVQCQFVEFMSDRVYMDNH